MPLTKEQRDALPDDHFAVPGKRKLPLPDETHTRLAWDMVDRTQGLSDEERSAAREHIKRRAVELGMDTSGWDQKLEHSAVLYLEAVSIDLPEDDNHPNRMPFTGVLTYVDVPSDLPVGGAGGNKTFLPKAVAEAMLPSLLMMPIDFKPNFDGHDVKRKIGAITAATIEGNAVRIEGFFYAADFPQECARIKAEKEALGFSNEIQAQTLLREPGLLQIVGGKFTGAAVLYKDKAAYQTTSLAATATEEIEMTDAELKALLAEALKPVGDAVAKLTTDLNALKAGDAALQANKDIREKIAPHATALRNCAASMEAAGIGMDSANGHVKVLHHMAAHMEAEAATGKVPFIYRDHDWTFRGAAETLVQPKVEDSEAFKALKASLDDVTTKLVDLKAQAFKQVEAPARKTVSAESTKLLAKGGITEAPTAPLNEEAVDRLLEAAGVTSTTARIEAKLRLTKDGLMVR